MPDQSPTEKAPSLRKFYSDLLDYEGPRLYEDIVEPWIPTGQKLLTPLISFADMETSPTKKEELNSGLWALFAFNRINDFLLSAFQCTSKEALNSVLEMSQYFDFFRKLGGFTFVEPTEGEAFSSFHHEVFQVEQSASADEPISVAKCRWPGVRFGHLMFSRCGADVRGGINFIDKSVAESSTSYFTSRRLHRPCEDLSLGWGSNSQWRTAFRRDYQYDDNLFYNVDGTNDLSPTTSTDVNDDGLTITERIELCKNRNFILTPKPHADLYLYNDRYREPR